LVGRLKWWASKIEVSDLDLSAGSRRDLPHNFIVANRITRLITKSFIWGVKELGKYEDRSVNGCNLTTSYGPNWESVLKQHFFNEDRGRDVQNKNKGKIW
jgi:hypothetical protein